MAKKRCGFRWKTTLCLLSACVCAALVLGLGTPAVCAAEAKPTQTGGTADAPLELPIRENPVAALGDKFYVIRSDGTLIESEDYAGYGARDTGDGFTFNRTREVMGNAAAVYAFEESAALAVDREGGLWYVRWGGGDSWIRAILPDFTQHYDDYPKPLKLLENVAMASADSCHAVILKRDGTLWVAGSNKNGAPWLDKEDGNEDFYFTRIMDSVIWADTTDYGGYAVTAGHELWAWGLSEDSAGPEKLLDGIARVCSNNTAITEDGKLVNWYYTKREDGSGTWCEPYVIELDSKVTQTGRGYYILEDGSFRANTAGWMNRMSDYERHMLLKYGVMTQPDWCKITPDSAPYLELGVKDAAYAAVGRTRSVVLDKNGVLWGVYDLNREWKGDFDPFQPIRLMDGCYGAKGPATYGMDNFKKVQEYRPGTFSDVKESDWFYGNVKTAYELNLMVGDAGKFRPNDTITLGEAAAIASRVRAVYWGDKLEFPAMQTWWQPYVYYAQATELHEIREETDGYGNRIGLNYTRPATRGELASLLCRTLPLEALPVMNIGAAFSDFESGEYGYSSYTSDALSMAEAGIVAGKEDGTFDSNAPVTRCEAAAMLTRCAYPELRVVTGKPGKAIVELDGYYTTEEAAAWAEKYGLAIERVFMAVKGEYGELVFSVANNDIPAGIEAHRRQIEEGALSDPDFTENYQRLVGGEYKVFALIVTVDDEQLELLTNGADCVRRARVQRQDMLEIASKPNGDI